MARPSFAASAPPPAMGPGVVPAPPPRLRPALRASLQASRRAKRRSSQAIARAEAARTRADTRDWALARRERTRHLIELGGLLTKAGVVELVEDDRATLLGALLELAARLRDGDHERSPDQLRAAWRHAGLRAFHKDREAQVDGTAGSPSPPSATSPPHPEPGP